MSHNDLRVSESCIQTALRHSLNTLGRTEEEKMRRSIGGVVGEQTICSAQSRAAD
jgi:hypothetical protein